MITKRVKDLMVPLDEYPVLPRDATLLDALLERDKAHEKLPSGRQPYRAVLVSGQDGNIIGKVGQIAFLKALEPQANYLSDVEKIRASGVSSDFVDRMMGHFRFFQDDLTVLCAQASGKRLGDVMIPITDSIDEDSTWSEAIYRIVALQSMSLLVTRKGRAVGLLRLSDLFETISDQMKGLANQT